MSYEHTHYNYYYNNYNYNNNLLAALEHCHILTQMTNTFVVVGALAPTYEKH